MDFEKILEELHTERDQLDEAISVIEILASKGTRKRGRPPAWMTKRKLKEPMKSAIAEGRG